METDKDHIHYMIETEPTMSISKIVNPVSYTHLGSVARGVCEIDGAGKLVSVIEHTTIVKRGENAAYTEDDGKSYTELARCV